MYCRKPPASRGETGMGFNDFQEFSDGTVVMVQTTITRQVFRVAPPHPDEVPCEPDPRLARLMDDRTPEERGVAIMRYEEAWAKTYAKLLRKRRKSKTKTKAKIAPKYAGKWWQ